MVSYRLRKYSANLLFFVSRIYFMLTHFSFWLVNSLFSKRKYVTVPTDQLLLMSARQAVKMISRRELTSTDLFEAYIRRIEQVNGDLNAVVLKLFNSARKQAQEVDRFIENASDEQVQKKIEEKPLFGVPFTIKDALEVEGENITCGIWNRKETICEKSAESVIRMQNAGGILLAVTNVPEMCVWVESVNKIYGRTKNPYDTRKMAGGSSGGEGALIGAAGSVIGIGSDFGGSIRMPAFFNGIFGLQATPGVIPFTGHIPEVTGYKKEMLRVGPLCRYAEDLPVMLKVLAGENVNKLNLDEPVSRNKLKICYMEELVGSIFPTLDDDVRYSLKKAVETLERKYNVIAQKVDFPLAKYIMEFVNISVREESTDPPLNKLILCDEASKGEVNSNQELMRIATGKSNHNLITIIFGMIDAIEQPYSPERTKELAYKRDRLKEQVMNLLGDDGILLFPSWPSTALFHNEPLLSPFNLLYTALWNVLAVPVVQCPLGLNSQGVPLGVQIIGNQFTERNLIAVAQDIEESYKGWVPPGSLS